MEDTKKIIIFASGSVRSGTTLLNLIIANDPDGLALGEIEHIFHPCTKAHYDKINELKQDPAWRTIIQGGKRNLYKNILQLFPDKKIIVDSSKDPFWYAEQMSFNKNLNIKNILIYKHPLDLKQSIEKRGDRNWEKIFIRYNQRYFSLIPFFKTVSLHSLINNDLALKEMCRYLEISFFNGKRNYWERKHPNFFGSTTVKKKRISKDNLIPNDRYDDYKNELESAASHTQKIRTIIKDLLARDILNEKCLPVSNNNKYNKFDIYWIRTKQLLVYLREQLRYRLRSSR